jgi:hypothetical protein
MGAWVEDPIIPLVRRIFDCFFRPRHRVRVRVSVKVRVRVRVGFLGDCCIHTYLYRDKYKYIVPLLFSVFLCATNKVSALILFCRVVSCLVLSCRILSSLVLSFRILSCRVVSYLVLACLVLRLTIRTRHGVDSANVFLIMVSPRVRVRVVIFIATIEG